VRFSKKPSPGRVNDLRLMPGRKKYKMVENCVEGHTGSFVGCY